MNKPIISSPGSDHPIDVELLYRTHARNLVQIVRHDLHEVSDAVIEDACQFAWTRLVFHAARIRAETALSWLARTAIHEAFKLIRRQALEVPLEEPDEDQQPGGETRLWHSVEEDPCAVSEARSRLALTAQISERQGKIVWLHALGFSYEEIGVQTGSTPRTVQRQLLRGRRSLRALKAA